MILVSILGDFHSSMLPLFFEFRDKLTHHIIIYDDSEYDKKHIKKITKAQIKFCKYYNLFCKISTIKIAEDDYDNILKAYEIIIKKDKPKNIYLNATDGLNSISIVLSNKLLNLGAKVLVYDRYANTYNIHTTNKMIKKQISHNIDIKNHLKLKGYKLLNYTNKYALKNRKEQILQLTKDLVSFKNYANIYQEYQKPKGAYTKILQKIDKQDTTFIQGGVFEEYIYWLIKDNIQVDDIMTGVIIEFDKDFQNELDILFIKDNHLHTIECKFTDNFKTNEYLYKVDSIMSFLDDDGKGMILSVGNKKLGWQDEARAKNNDINFYSVKKFNKQKFLDEIKRFFNLKAK